MIPKAVFLLGLAIAARGLVSPPVALALGLVFGFSFPHPFDQSAKKLSRCLLQASVVGLGFGMNPLSGFRTCNLLKVRRRGRPFRPPRSVG